MLFPDDVLYHSWWMDAVLLCQKLQWRFRRCGYGDGIGGFSDMLGNMPLMTFWTILICIIGFGVCAFGIQKGIEKYPSS